MRVLLDGVSGRPPGTELDDAALRAAYA
ncbi:MAG: hypothetical protein QOG47_2860, partial [Mycobacterium sp.]|nr:hypothetical protein [Mycobacterium sp.]